MIFVRTKEGESFLFSLQFLSWWMEKTHPEIGLWEITDVSSATIERIHDDAEGGIRTATILGRVYHAGKTRTGLVTVTHAVVPKGANKDISPLHAVYTIENGIFVGRPGGKLLRVMFSGTEAAVKELKSGPLSADNRFIELLSPQTVPFNQSQLSALGNTVRMGPSGSEQIVAQIPVWAGT